MKEIKYRQLVGKDWHYWGYIDGFFVGPITNQQPEPINCQYTGLKDANGVEIYEGDIVEDEEHYVSEIYWDNNNAMFCASDVGSLADLSCCPELYVIGNIHQNPKLLSNMQEA